MRISESEYMDLLEKAGRKTARQKPKRNKYNNKKTWVDGVCFDSKKEAEYYLRLRLLQQTGDITGFCRQPEFVLVEGNAEERAITYRADFIVFFPDSTYEIIDVKGYETQQWKRTFKMFRLKFPELDLEIEK